MITKFSDRQIDYVSGAVANRFPNHNLRELRAIVSEALNWALIHQANQKAGRLDSAGIRADSADTGSSSKKKPAPSSLQQKRLDAEEAIKQQYKNPRTMPHERLKKADSKPAMPPPQGPDTRSAEQAKQEMQEAIKNQYQGGK